MNYFVIETNYQDNDQSFCYQETTKWIINDFCDRETKDTPGRVRFSEINLASYSSNQQTLVLKRRFQ